MKVLVTGAKGFVGENLCAALRSIADGKDHRACFRALDPLEIWESDVDTSDELLQKWCAEADFVFNLAGVNRPRNTEDFMRGNYGFASKLLGLLESCGNKCPVMLSSSVQASLEGRFGESEYGQSKLAGEELFFDYAQRVGAPVFIYRFPNIYGKWCRPNYNSAVATFCFNIARDMPVQVNDPSTELQLVYIDDVVEEMLQALIGGEHRCDYEGIALRPSQNGRFCYVPRFDTVQLGDIVKLLLEFKDNRMTLGVSDMSEGSFCKKLYSTYLSYVPPEDFEYPLATNIDERGSFTELIRTANCGQFSVNVCKPGVTKGNHWHHSKWEKFCVVSGEALIRLRRIGVQRNGSPYPVLEYRVSGDDIRVVEMIPGYTHSISNLSNNRDLVTLMWANECFDPDHPDTFYEEV